MAKIEYFFFTMFIVVFILVVNIFNSHAKNVGVKDEPICETEMCHKTAIRIKGNMNPDANPCTDFYEYACGNWPKFAGKSVYAALGFITTFNLNRIMNNVTSSERNTPLGKAKMFYESCTNTDKIKNNTIPDLIRIMDKHGGWPIVMSENDWLSKNKSWQDVDLAYRKITNNSPIFSLKMKNLINKTDTPIIELSPSIKAYNNYISVRISVSLDTFMALPIVINYMNVIKNVSKIIANHRNYFLSEKRLEEDVKNIVKFEWELESILRHGARKTMHKESNVDISIDDFQKNYSSICCKTENSRVNWLNMIRQYFDDDHGIYINGSQIININEKSYFELSDVLDRTSLRTIVNTIHWQFIVDSRHYMSHEMESLLEMIIYPSKNFLEFDNKPNCLKLLHKEFVNVLSYNYVQKVFPKKAKNTIARMTSEIAHEMEAMINSSTLLDDNFRSDLLMSMKSMKHFIAYPDWYDNKTEVDHYYDNVKISESWLENIWVMKKFNLNRLLKAFKDLNIRRNDWNQSPIKVNAYYDDESNSIVIPAALIQSPFFKENQPDVVNYGSIGFIIGHEISHSLLISERCDEKKKLKPWWNSADTKFEGTVYCLIDQYSKYSFFLYNQTYNVNSQITLRENIADNLGIRVTYEAFQAHKIKVNESKIRLPGLENLDSNQLFFLSFAQTKCSSQNLERLLLEMFNVHSPTKFRITGSLSNNKQFAEAFQCSNGTGMNPIRKCSLL